MSGPGGRGDGADPGRPAGGGAAVELADASRLPVLVTGPRSPLWWGMVGLVVIESVVFASLVSAYFYLGFHAAAWPPAGVETPDLLLPTAGLGILLASALVLRWGHVGIARGNATRLTGGLATAVALAGVFLALRAVEYGALDYGWDTHAYGSIVWTMVGLHSAHVLAVVLKTLVAGALTVREHFTRARRVGIEIGGIYWYFTVAIWVPLYVVIYLVPRL